MREPTIARNYAEALFESGEKLDSVELFADLIGGLAGAIEVDDSIRIALESPRVPKEKKQDVLSKGLAGKAPPEFVRFLGAVIRRGRQNLFGAIAEQYSLLVDEKFQRVHAGVTLAREPDDVLREEIRTRLSGILGKEVIPHYRVNRDILGGVQVRVGDVTMDGSVRRKLKALRRKMLNA